MNFTVSDSINLSTSVDIAGSHTAFVVSSWVKWQVAVFLLFSTVIGQITALASRALMTASLPSRMTRSSISPDVDILSWCYYYLFR